jgi:hypothetical protein
MTRHRKFSNCRAMVLAGTLALLCNAKTFPADVASGDWPEVNHDKLGTRYSPLALINTSNAKNLTKSANTNFPRRSLPSLPRSQSAVSSTQALLTTPSRSMGSTVT